MKPFEKSHATVRVERTWLVPVALAVAVFALPLLAPLGELRAMIATDWAAVVVYVAIVGVALSARKLWKRSRSGSLRADGVGVAIDGDLVARRVKVRGAEVRARANRTIVRINQRFAEVDVEVADAVEGEALLVALGIEPRS